MTCLPLIERELLLRARKPSTRWLRLAVGLTSLLICLPQLLMPSGFGGAANLGVYVFNGIAGAIFVLCCSACLWTADVIGSERREGTLGLLFLTRVNSLDLLLGKFGAAGASSLCALLTCVPILMVPVLAGGVTGGEAVRKGLVLINTLFFSLTAGLYYSARGAEWTKTARAAIVLVAVITVVPAPLSQSATLVLPQISLAMISPLTAFVWAGDGSYKAAWLPFWVSLSIVHSLSWLLLAGASLRLAKTWREDMGASAFIPAIQGSHPQTMTRTCQTAPLGEREPIEWLVRRQRGVRAMIWTAALLAVFYPFLPLLGLMNLIGRSAYIAFMWPMGFVMSGAESALMVLAASRFLMTARKTGEFELLRTTPVGAETLIRAQWTVLKQFICWPVFLMCTPPLLWFFRQLFGLNPGPFNWTVYYGVSVVLNLVLVCLRVATLCWMGLWFGLKAKSRAQAIAWAIGLVQGVPYLIQFAFSLLVFPFCTRLMGFSSPSITIVLMLPSLVVAWYLLRLLGRARQRVTKELERDETGPLLWKRDITEMIRSIVVDIRRARHWTPS